MDLNEAKTLARTIMDQHGLYDWTFKFDRSKRRLGVCYVASRVIALSGPITALNDEAQVTSTIIHEVAHALCPANTGHGPAWKAMMRKLGVAPERTSSTHVRTSPKYLLHCPNCGYSIPRHRKSTATACGRCCKKYNGGRYTEKYDMVWTEYRPSATDTLKTKSKTPTAF